MKRICTFFVVLFLCNALCFGQTEAKIFPNPAKKESVVTFTSEDNSSMRSAVLFTENGKPVAEAPTIVGDKVRLPAVARGFYVLRIVTTSGKTISKKIIIT